jgi:hypothetical protein
MKRYDFNVRIAYADRVQTGRLIGKDIRSMQLRLTLPQHLHQSNQKRQPVVIQ